MKTTKRSLFTSFVSLLLCFSMFLGTTWAWYTDEVTNSKNKIQSGTLAVDLELLNQKTGKWKSVKESHDPIFNYDRWEPGYTDVKVLRIKNTGSLALKWVAQFVSEYELSELANVIDVYVLAGKDEIGYPTSSGLDGYTKVGTVAQFVNTLEQTTWGVLEAKECAYLGIALHMREDADDKYQGMSLCGEFDIRILAKQWTVESGSFGDQYDQNATYPTIVDNLRLWADLTGKLDANNKLTEEVKLYDRTSGVTATLPVGTQIADGVSKIRLQITEGTVSGKITLDLRVGYDVTIEGVAASNEKPIVVYMPKVLPAEQSALQLYHEGNAMTRVYTVEALSEKENPNDTYGDKFLYDFATGDVTFSVTHFSNVSLASSTNVLVNGTHMSGEVINLGTPGNWLQNGVITIPADGNTYILTYENTNTAKKNDLSQTITHTWHNINPGVFTTTPIKVEKGATVVLNGVNIRTASDVDALELINPANTNAGTVLGETHIYVADGTENYLTGKSGIGFGANSANLAVDVYVEGQGNLYATAIGIQAPGIGVDSYSDGNKSRMHFAVGFLRAIPTENAAGIGGGADGNALDLIELNGGTYRSYRGGNAASIGAGANGDCGDIVINANSNVFCYVNPWDAYGRDMGHGIEGGECTGIYVSKDADVYGYDYTTNSYVDWIPNNGFVPEGRENDALVIVEDFESLLTNITFSTAKVGELTKVTASFNGKEIEIDPAMCSFDGTTVSVAAVIKGDEVHYLSTATKVEAEVNKVISISSITASGYQLQYFVGGALNLSGLTLTVNYSEGNPEILTEGFEVTGFDSTTAGEKTFTVTYKGVTTTFTVNVIAITPASAVITTNPKTDYFVGDTLDLTGLVITVTNNDGSTYEVSEGFTANVSTFAAAGVQTVQVTVDGVTAEFSVNVTAVELDHIEIKQLPDQTEYFVGDELDLTGLKITAVYNNGGRDGVDAGYTITGGASAAGTQTITVTYGGKTATFEINVTAVELVGIEVTAPTKTEYYAGDALDLAGMKVTAIYNNGATRDVTDAATVTGSAATAGTQTITVTYEGKTASFDINVTAVELVGVEVTAPTKTEYFAGDALDLAGMKVVAVYNNGDRVELTDGYKVSSETAVLGQTSITVEYNNKTATFEIVVKEVVLEKIEVTKPTNTTYFENVAIDFAGMTITAVYNNGDRVAVTENYTVSCEVATLGQETITVTYEGKTATFEIDVIEIVVDRIELTAPEKLTGYYVGDDLDLAGMKVVAVYNNNDRVEVTEGYTISGDASAAGQRAITIIYEGKRASFTITVAALELDRIEITTPPKKNEYFKGEALDLAGMEITLYYVNGKSKKLETTAYSTSGDTDTAGERTITITFNGKSDSFKITVKDIVPESIKVVSAPTKTEYNVGDSLDYTGLVVEVTFNNGNVITIASENGEKPKDLIIADYTNLLPDHKTILVGYLNIYDSFEVTVKADVNFLYRVGNQNNVTLAQISKLLTGADVQNDANVVIEKYVGEVSYANNKFTGTGVVKVTIGNSVYYLEVVNAKNTTTGNIRNEGLLNGTNFVLLNDVKYTETQTITMDGATIYGNGFKFDFSEFTPQASELDNVFVIHMKNATLDNVQIIGKVYTDGAYVYKADSSADRENYMSLLFATGDSKILNCYVSGTRAPVRAEGNVEITNSTLAGGNVANIDVKGGTLTLNDVTTINQGTNPVGYGIFMDNDAGKDEDGNPQPITIKINGLTSYNWLTAEDTNNMDDKSSQKPMPTLLEKVFADANFAGAEAINFKVVCLNDLASVTVNGLGDPVIASISGSNGRLWCETGSKVDAPDYEPNGTGTVPPVFTWSEYSATTEFYTGGSVTFNADLLKAEKYGQNLNVNMSSNGGTISGKNIIFNVAGTYTITYQVKDTNNYYLNLNGELVGYDVDYTFKITVTVSEVEPQTKHAEFTIAGSATTIVEKDGKKYVVANSLGSYTDASKTDNAFGFKYPEVATLMSDNINGQHSSGYKACYPIFEAVTITDYENGGLGAAVTYNSSTKALPSGLKYVTDRDLYYAYSSYKLSYQAKSAGDTTKGSTVSDKLCFTSPSVTANRSEHFTWIEYSYTDNAGETYYFVIGYRAQAQTYKSCVTGDTLVTLADGTQKRIDQVTYADQLLVWNFFEGKYDVVPSAIIFDHGEDTYRVLNLNFEDGTTVKVIHNHGFFDMEKNAFIYISEENVNDYVGDHFAKMDGDGRTAVQLVGYSITEEYTGCYSIQAAVHINFITEGMFSQTIPEYEGWFDYFEIGDDMKYDEAKMQADIEAYGLYEYEVFAEYGVTYEQFIAFNGPYLKVLVGRGVVTFEQILGLIASYVVPN